MEVIKPDKDEVDAFHTQRNGSKAQAFREQVRAEAESQPVTRVDVPVEQKNAGPGKAAGGPKWLVVSLAMLVLVLSGLFAWQVRKHEETIAVMEDQLFKAQKHIEQSQLVVARLEGQIFKTDATMAQSGNELAREIKRMDTELRKLGKQFETLNGQVSSQSASQNSTLDKLTQQLHPVAAQIKTLGEALATAEAQIKGVTARQNEQDGQLESLVPSVEGVKTDLAGAKADSVRLLGEVERLQTALQSDLARMAELETSVGKLTRATTNQVSAASVKELSQRVEAIDATRAQLVQRFVTLDRKLNEMTLEMQAIRASNKGGLQ
jgi:chromosome segregation ATPase